jgi:C1A family cysteine protease
VASKRLISFLVVCGSSLPTSAICQSDTLPAHFDWKERGIVTQARDQGEFGTCWAFAAVGLMESLIKKGTGDDLDLSEQYLISNVDGVSPFLAVEYLKANGVILEEDLPYQGDTATVKSDRPGEFFLTDYVVTNVHGLSLPDRIRTIKQIVHEYGPVVTTMNLYDDFRHYRSGVYVYDGRSPEQPGGHIILITGWTDDPAVVNGGYWTLKNSAGQGWGEDGFGKAAYGQAGIDDYYVIHGIYRP